MYQESAALEAGGGRVEAGRTVGILAVVGIVGCNVIGWAGRQQVWWARGRRTRRPAYSNDRSAFNELQSVVVCQYSIR